MSRKKQFIAGAICPKCSEIDSLVLYADDQSVACVSCDFTKSSQQRDLDVDRSADKQIKSTPYQDANLIKITNLNDLK